MRYLSTRDASTDVFKVSFSEAVLQGLAPDGGLYVPETYPQIAKPKESEGFVDVFSRIAAAFAGDDLMFAEIEGMTERAYSRFAHKAVTPLVQTDTHQFMLELHHGPTLAFKDVAMQFIGELFDVILEKRGERRSVICATSGDTGGAAAAAFANKENIDLFILHPEGRISSIQREFMTKTGAPNVHNLAISGSFDDTQGIVKALFADRSFCKKVGLSAVNSINWARILAQTVYFAMAQATLGANTPLRFVVPSGNYGDALACFVTHKMGLLAQFDCLSAVNENDALALLINEGRLKKVGSKLTPSPAMDIQNPSNFERLLFEVGDRDANLVRNFYHQYAQSGYAEFNSQFCSALAENGIRAISVSNVETRKMMTEVFANTASLICPHTAVGFKAAKDTPAAIGVTDIVLATAHPAKFPKAVSEATGHEAKVPAYCNGSLQNEEIYVRHNSTLSAVKDYILKHKV